MNTIVSEMRTFFFLSSYFLLLHLMAMMVMMMVMMSVNVVQRDFWTAFPAFVDVSDARMHIMGRFRTEANIVQRPRATKTILRHSTANAAVSSWKDWKRGRTKSTINKHIAYILLVIALQRERRDEFQALTEQMLIRSKRQMDVIMRTGGPRKKFAISKRNGISVGGPNILRFKAAIR